MRWTKSFAATVLAFGLAAAPLASAGAADAHHPSSGGPMGTGMPGPMGGGTGHGGMMPGPMSGGMPGAMHGGMMEFPPRAAMWGELSLTPAQARDLLEARLILHGNDRLRVGSVEAEGDAIAATVETVDGSLVRTLRIDPTTGAMRSAD